MRGEINQKERELRDKDVEIERQKQELIARGAEVERHIRGCDQKTLKIGMLKATTLCHLNFYSKWGLTPLTATDEEYAFVTGIFLQSQGTHAIALGSKVHGARADVQIEKIEKLCLPRIQQLYVAERNNLQGKFASRRAPPLDVVDSTLQVVPGDALNEVLVWHGTTETNVESITRMGFDLREEAVSGKNLGLGNYFAPRASKADDYTDRATRTGRQQLRKLILTRVLLGKPHVAKTTLGNIRRAPDGCDSVVAWAGAPFENSEIVVYKDTQTLPAYVVSFTHLPGCGCAFCKQRPA